MIEPRRDEEREGFLIVREGFLRDLNESFAAFASSR
jgi:hypothetical protein